MAKTLLYRLFGIGKMPEQMVAQLKGEGLLLMDDGMKGSTTYVNFRAPGRSASWRRVWFTASIALTELRVVALQASQTIINVPLTDERLRSMHFSRPDRDTLLVAFDAGLFHADWSGRIEYRFSTPLAQDFVDRLGEQSL